MFICSFIHLFVLSTSTFYLSIISQKLRRHCWQQHEWYLVHSLKHFANWRRAQTHKLRCNSGIWLEPEACTGVWCFGKASGKHQALTEIWKICKFFFFSGRKDVIRRKHFRQRKQQGMLEKLSTLPDYNTECVSQERLVKRVTKEEFIRCKM